MESLPSEARPDWGRPGTPGSAAREAEPAAAFLGPARRGKHRTKSGFRTVKGHEEPRSRHGTNQKPGKTRAACTGISLQEKAAQEGGADGGGLLPSAETRGKAEVCWRGDDSVAPREPGPCPGEPQTPSLARKDGFRVPVGLKGQRWQGKEILRSLSLRGNISDAKKLSIGRAGAKGSKCPSLLAGLRGHLHRSLWHYLERRECSLAQSSLHTERA